MMTALRPWLWIGGVAAGVAVVLALGVSRVVLMIGAIVLACPIAMYFGMRAMRGPQDAGAAGWCLHNGDTRDGSPERRPRRSFDLRDGSLFDQLDDEEREFLRRLKTGR